MARKSRSSLPRTEWADLAKRSRLHIQDDRSILDVTPEQLEEEEFAFDEEEPLHWYDVTIRVSGERTVRVKARSEEQATDRAHDLLTATDYDLETDYEDARERGLAPEDPPEGQGVLFDWDTISSSMPRPSSTVVSTPSTAADPPKPDSTVAMPSIPRPSL